MAGFDFAAWIDSAAHFVSGLSNRLAGDVSVDVRVEPALSAAAVGDLTLSLGLAIPDSVERFLEDGSGGATFRYSWAPPEEVRILAEGLLGDRVWGGTAVCVASSMSTHLRECREWARDTWLKDF